MPALSGFELICYLVWPVWSAAEPQALLPLSLDRGLMATVIVDDTDPRLAYAGQWTLGGKSGEYNETTHGGTTPGSSVAFSFQGTFVSVHGSIGSTIVNGIPHSTYQLDNLSPTDYVAPFSLGGIVNHTFYSSPDLANDQHTLVVILSSHPAVLWLDYLTYTTSNDSTSSSPSLGPPSTNSQQSSSSTYDPSSTLPILSSSTVSSPSTTGSSSTATQPSDLQANTTSSRETTVGKVVCIICGVLFAIGAVTVGVVIWKSRRARRAREGQLSPITTQDIGRPLRGAFPSTPYTSSAFLQYPRSLASSPTVYHHTPHYSMSATGRIPQTTTPFRRSFTDLPHLPWRSSSPRIHSDAGVRLNGEHLEGNVVDYGGDSLPPPYVDRRARNVHHPLLQVSSRSSISRTM